MPTTHGKHSKGYLDGVFIARSFIYVGAFAMLAYGIFPCIGLTFDSELYLKTAANLPEKGLVQPGFMAKPPLYSLIIFAVGNSLWTLSVLNLLCWVGSVVLIESILEKLPNQSDWEKIFYSLCVACSTPLFLVHNFVWTEPVFSVLVFCFFATLGSQYSKRQVLLATVVVLMVALRHMGVLFVLGGIIGLSYSGRISRRDLAWVASSISFFVLWQFFVYHHRGDMGRLDHFASLDLVANYRQLGRGLMHWFVPIEVPLLPHLLPLLIGGLVLWGFVQYKESAPRAFFATVLLHFAMIISKGDLIYDDVERYLFFLHPLLFPLVYHGLRQTKLSKPIALTAMMLLVGYTIIRTLKNSLFWHDAFCP